MSKLGAVTVALLLASAGSAQAFHYDPPPPHTGGTAAARDAITMRSLAPDARVNPPLAPAGLPITWCGSPQPAGLLSPRTVPAFQIVYAHPADQPDHFARFADLLQADASYIDRYIAAESYHSEFMRFAMGTACGPQYVSLIDWRMPQARAAYVDRTDGGSPNFSAFNGDAAATFGRAAGVNTLIYLDGLLENPSWTSDTFGGIAEGLAIGDSSPGPGNLNNQGQQFSYVIGLVGGRPAPGEQALAPTTLLHEASHAIGAVNNDAPNSTHAAHCNVTQDIMCYADGGPLGQAANLHAGCGYRNDVMVQPYDCTGNDYFNPRPAAGSFLASHWNVYNSTFMAPCTENERACGTTQSPIGAAVKRRIGAREVRLTLTAVTLPDRIVKLVASVTGIPARSVATVCLYSDALSSGNSTCTTARPRHGRAGAGAIVLPADGQGWRTASASVRVVRAGAHAARRQPPLGVVLRLP